MLSMLSQVRQRHRGERDVEIDAVQQRSREPRTVSASSGWGMPSFAFHLAWDSTESVLTPRRATPSFLYAA